MFPRDMKKSSPWISHSSSSSEEIVSATKNNEEKATFGTGGLFAKMLDNSEIMFPRDMKKSSPWRSHSSSSSEEIVPATNNIEEKATFGTGGSFDKMFDNSEIMFPRDMKKSSPWISHSSSSSEEIVSATKNSEEEVTFGTGGSFDKMLDNSEIMFPRDMKKSSPWRSHSSSSSEGIVSATKNIEEKVTFSTGGSFDKMFDNSEIMFPRDMKKSSPWISHSSSSSEEIVSATKNIEEEVTFGTGVFFAKMLDNSEIMFPRDMKKSSPWRSQSSTSSEEMVSATNNIEEKSTFGTGGSFEKMFENSEIMFPRDMKKSSPWTSHSSSFSEEIVSATKNIEEEATFGIGGSFDKMLDNSEIMFPRDMQKSSPWRSHSSSSSEGIVSPTKNIKEKVTFGIGGSFDKMFDNSEIMFPRDMKKSSAWTSHSSSFSEEIVSATKNIEEEATFGIGGSFDKMLDNSEIMFPRDMQKSSPWRSHSSSSSEGIVSATKNIEEKVTFGIGGSFDKMFDNSEIMFPRDMKKSSPWISHSSSSSEEIVSATKNIEEEVTFGTGGLFAKMLDNSEIMFPRYMKKSSPWRSHSNSSSEEIVSATKNIDEKVTFGTGGSFAKMFALRDLDADYSISPSSIPKTTSYASSSSRQFREVICNICMEDKTFEMFPNKGSCGHLFCSDCISKHIDAKIKENITIVTCPEPNCKILIKPEVCRDQSLVPKEILDRWDNALCESLIKGSEKFYCPFKDCSALLVDEGGEAVTSSECPHCNRLFCAQCKVSWHSGMDCKEYLAKKGEIARSDNMLMDLAKNKKWKRCTNCNFYVERTDGCEHITCRCGYQFCYECGNKWNGGHLCEGPA